MQLYKRSNGEVSEVLVNTNKWVGGKKIIALGPFTGGYGHFFCQYLTALAGLRERNPDAFIVASAPHVFAGYALRFADAFYGIKHTWSAASTAQEYHLDAQLNPELSQFHEIVTKALGEPDKYYNTFLGENHCHLTYTSLFGNEMPILRDVNYNAESDLILIWGRMKKGADWRNGNAKMWRDTIEHLQKQGFRIGICGSRGTSMFFEDLDGVIDYTDYDDVERGSQIHQALQDARCVLVDMSGTICESYLVGCPTLTFNSDPRHVRVIPQRNIFGTKETIVIPERWSNWQKNPLSDGDMLYMGMWLNAVDEFIGECGEAAPYESAMGSGKNILWGRDAIVADKDVRVYGPCGKGSMPS